LPINDRTSRCYNVRSQKTVTDLAKDNTLLVYNSFIFYNYKINLIVQKRTCRDLEITSAYFPPPSHQFKSDHRLLVQATAHAVHDVCSDYVVAARQGKSKHCLMTSLIGPETGTVYQRCRRSI
jgi:hypothetical protein